MFPFPGGPDSLSNGTLLFSAGAALLYLLVLPAAPSWRRTAIKTLPVALLSLLVLLEGGPWLLAAALAFSAAGDAFLSRHGERAFLGGLAAFLAAHLVYVVLFAAAGTGLSSIAAEWWRAGAVLVALVAGGLMWRLLAPVLAPSMRLAVGAYVLAILAMGIAAATVPAIAIIAGALLFIASDAVLAVERFLMRADDPARRLASYLVWPLYYAAQATIALAFII